VIGRGHHLSDDRLVDYYFAAAAGEPLDPPIADHLGECVECRARAVELTAFLDGARADADAESDEIFGRETLRHQHEQILRHLEHVNRPARVLSFPQRVTRGISRKARRIAPRWLAVGAAASFFVGVALGGLLLQPGLHGSVPGLRVATHSAYSRTSPAPRLGVSSAARAIAPLPITDAVDDDAFLQELELALERTPTRELQLLDALTPHVREVGSRLR
jgi:hypothetical protein